MSQNRDHAEIRRNQSGVRQEESMVILYGGIIESSRQLWIRLGPKGKRKRNTD